VAASLSAHALMLLALLWRPTPPDLPPPPPPIAVELVQDPAPPPPAPPPPTEVAVDLPAPPRPTPPSKPAARRSHARITRAPAQIVSVATAEPGPAADADESLSDAQIAGAASAGSGPAGGACDMARRLQGALRRDPLVRAAVASSAGKAIMVWNGDWVRHGGEDGKGLAAVREAIMWEIAFSPKACRAEAQHGLILLSLNDGRGSTRLAMGEGEWRWSDLLTARR
jgi:hypothetical protein